MNTGHHNERGRYYEVLFKAECLKRGLVVLSPECTHLPFDVALFVDGRFLRIQVKGTAHFQQKHKPDKGWAKCYRVPCVTSRRVSYVSHGIDFLVAYVEPLAAWYIVPAAMLTGRAFEVRPNSTGKAAQCKERWDFLGVPIATETEK